MNYKSYLTILLVIITIAQKCEPLYWQIDPTYIIPTKQIQAYATNPNFTVPDQSDIYGIFGNQTTYSFSNISTKAKYDDTNKIVKFNGNTIEVNNMTLNFFFKFNATKHKNLITKQYDGVGTASLLNVSISYTKNFQIIDGTPIFNLIKSSILTPNSITLDSLIPTPRQEIQIEHFQTLANVKMYGVLKSLINQSITFFLFDVFSKQSFQNPFGGSQYNYVYNNYITTFNTEIDQLTLGNPNGRIVGYNGSLVGIKSQQCSQFVPDKPYPASYITLGFINNLWSSYVQNPAWQSLTINHLNTNSDIFQFYMIDLEDVIPQALIDFPSFLNKLSAKCNIQSNQGIIIDKFTNTLSTRIKWNCGLYEQSGTNLLNMKVEIGYNAKLQQVGKVLKVTVSNVKLNNVQWNLVQDYPVSNVPLANNYLLSLMNSFNNMETVGSNFRQNQKKNPKYVFEDNLITIVEFPSSSNELMY